MKLKSSLVLLSSGLDSTCNMYLANKKSNLKLSITFDYGQKSAKREIYFSKLLSQSLNIPHKIITLDWLNQGSFGALINDTSKIPIKSQVNLDSLKHSVNSAQAVWVPNRNGVFLNIAASIAEANHIDYVIPGFNIEEAQTFPDNSIDFLDASNNAFKYSTKGKVKVMSYTINMNKKMIVSELQKLEVNFNNIWPCYFGGENICRECESCKRFLRAQEIKVKGIVDEK